jgi:hypothetical protein
LLKVLPQRSLDPAAEKREENQRRNCKGRISLSKKPAREVERRSSSGPAQDIAWRFN